MVHSIGNAIGEIMVELYVNNQIMNFQVDTGASCSVIGSQGYRALGQPECTPTDQQLKGLTVPGKDIAKERVHCGVFDENLPLLVADCENATNILGLNWFHKLNFQVSIPNDIPYNNAIISSTGQASSESLISSLTKLTDEFTNIFKVGSGLRTTFKANIVLKPNAKP